MHKNRKIRSIRVTAFILSLASCLFLFSAGFSTWFKVVLPPGNTESGGSFQAYGVVDVIAPGAELNVSNFQYTSFGFVEIKENDQVIGHKNSIEITYTFSDDGKSANNDVWVHLGYTQLSGYAGSGFGLFSNLLTATYGENNTSFGNSITIKFNNPVTVLDAKDSSVSLTDNSFTIQSSNAGNFCTENGDHDAISFKLSGAKPNSLTITYTFNIDSSVNKGNFRQNLGKYLMAKEATSESPAVKTKFISTVVAAQ